LWNKKSKQNGLVSVYLTIQTKKFSKSFSVLPKVQQNGLEMVRKTQCSGRQTVGKNSKKTIKCSDLLVSNQILAAEQKIGNFWKSSNFEKVELLSK
jgi:hypothetical protein